MKNIRLYLILICIIPLSSFGQTWTGNTSSDWNTATNWSTNAIPLSTGVVIINATTAPKFPPKLSADISVASISMNAGSMLDVNGFSITTSNYFQTNGTFASPITINNSNIVNHIVINMNGNTDNYLRGAQFNGKIDLNINTSSSFTIGYTTAFCTFTDDVAIQSSSTGGVNISTNSTNIFSGDLTINMLQAAALNAFTTADTSKVLGNFEFNNLIGGQTTIGNTGKTTKISGKVNVNYNAEGLNSAFSLINMKNLTTGGQVVIQNPGLSTTISKDTLLVNSFSVLNYNNITGYYGFYFNYNRILGNTTISDSTTNLQGLAFGNNNIVGNFKIINNGNVSVNESVYGGNLIDGNVFYVKNGNHGFLASSTGVSEITGNYTFQCNNGGNINLFVAGTTTIGGNFSLTDTFGAITQVGNNTNITLISGKVYVQQNSIALNNNYLFYKLKNLTDGGSVAIQNTGGKTIVSNNTLLVTNFSITNYYNNTGYYGLNLYNNNISGNTTISDSTINNVAFLIGNNSIGGNFSIIKNSNSNVDESYYGGNTIGGNTLYIKNGAGDFRASSSSSIESEISGDYDFQCNNGSGNVYLFVSGITTIGGNINFMDTVGATTQIGNGTTTTLISGKMNLQYHGNALFHSFSMKRMKNMLNGGSVVIQNSGYITTISKDTLLVTDFSVVDYNNINGYNGLTFNDNNISGNAAISDLAANTLPLAIGNNTIGGNFTIIKNGPSEVNESQLGGNKIGGNVLYIKNGIGNFTASSNLSIKSEITGDYTFQCNNGTGIVQLFTGGINTIGGNFNHIDTVGATTQIGNGTNTTLISGKMNFQYNGNALFHSFSMKRMKNMMNGGSVVIQNTGYITTVSNDTLIVTDFSIIDYNNIVGYNGLIFNDNSISGNAIISDLAANTLPLAIGNNTISGNFTIIKNGSSDINESYYGGNKIGGNVLYIKNGSGYFIASSHASIESEITGNYTYKCNNGTGNTQLFIIGNTTIGGDINLIDTAGATTQIGNSTTTTLISGKMNLQYNGNALFRSFSMNRMKNMMNGGSVVIQNSGYITTISNDTLIVTDFSIIDYNNINGYNGLIFNNNSISGNATISDLAVNTLPLTLGNNSISGNFTIIKNGPSDINESYYGGNKIGGNVLYIKNGSGYFIASSHASIESEITGNYIFQCNKGGYVQLFIDGTTTIGGNFNIIDTFSAFTQIGNNTNTTLISGQVNIQENGGAFNNSYYLYNLKNLTGGGNVVIQRTGNNTNISNNTLIVDDFSIPNYSNIGGYNGLVFNNNSISGNTAISDSAINGLPLTISNNTINGSFILTGNGVGQIFESYNASNQINGNATFINNGSALMTIGYSQKSKITGDLNIKPSSLITISAVEMNGNVDGTINQLGINPIKINKLIINKSDTAKLYLSAPVLINTNVEFINGNILTYANKELIFANGSTVTSPSDSSKVLGPVSKIGNTAFSFPIGSLNKYAALGITAPGTVTDKFTANYIRKDPTLDGLDTALRAGTLERVSGYYYFDLKRDIGTSTVKVSVGYNTIFGAITNTASLRVGHWNGLIWEDLGNGGVVGDNIKGDITTAAAVSSFSPFALATIDAIANPLPLNLIHFAAINDGKFIKLNWIMAQDENLDQYIIEKSNDGHNFSPIGNVSSLNSKEKVEYLFTDNNPFEGNNFYRIKLLEKEGKYNYSKIIVVSIDKENEITLSPNPANGIITIINATGYDEYSIYDQSGKVALSGKIKDNNSQIRINSLKSGVYFIRLWNDHEDKKIKFIKRN